jgi:hypothetical protein
MAVYRMIHILLGIRYTASPFSAGGGGGGGDGSVENVTFKLHVTNFIDRAVVLRTKLNSMV